MYTFRPPQLWPTNMVLVGKTLRKEFSMINAYVCFIGAVVAFVAIAIIKMHLEERISR